MDKLKLPTDNQDSSVLKTIRIRKNKLDELEKTAIKNNLSINKLINICIDYALENLEDDQKINQDQKS